MLLLFRLAGLVEGVMWCRESERLWFVGGFLCGSEKANKIVGTGFREPGGGRGIKTSLYNPRS